MTRDPRIAGLLLAAGRSTRMGGVSKLLRTVGGVVLARRAALALTWALGGPLTVVVEPQGEGVRQALTGIDARFAVNPNPEEGMASSLRIGIASLPEKAEGVAVMLADLPLVKPQTIQALVAACAESGKTIVIPTYRGRRGHPVLFDLNAHREQFSTLTGDRGAREIISANPEAVLELEVDDPGILIDLDTEEALAANQFSPKLFDALALRPRELISLVGGGGKTTLMYRLGRELSATGIRTACAVTTKIMPPRPEDGATLTLLDNPAPPETEPGIIPVFGANMVENRKVVGIPPEWCDKIFGSSAFGYLIVEADGSRRLPLKAHGPDEPVTPAATTLIIAVVGLTALATPLDEAHAFRPGLISALTGVPPGSEITPETIAALLTHPEGLFRGAPDEARCAVFLNQADTPALVTLGREIALKILASNNIIERIVIGRLNAEEAVEELWER